MQKMGKLVAYLALAVLPLTAGCGGHAGMAYHGRGGTDAALERGLGEMRDLVDNTVKDTQKAKQAKEIVEAIVTEVRTSSQQNRKFHQRLYDLNADYNAAPEQFLKILDELNNHRMKSASTILGLRFKLKELLTAEEWKALTDGMNQARTRYGHGVGQESGGKSDN